MSAPPDSSRLERLIFLSHASVDDEQARALARRIAQAPAAQVAGVRVWLDRDDLQAGEAWQPQIERAISRSSAFVVYVGSRGVANWVEAEVRSALDRAVGERGYPFVPVLSAAAPPVDLLPSFVRQFEAVLAEGESDEWFEKLMAALLGRAARALEAHPFFGLRAMDESRSHLFFGREQETHELMERLVDAHLLMVVGDSGAGKSSLVRAGVIPKFRGGALASVTSERPDSQIWHTVVMQPRADPWQQLSEVIYEAGGPLHLSLEERATFARWAKSNDAVKVRRALRCNLPSEKTQLLLVVDQFEELWTNCTKAARNAFVSLLLELADSPDRSIRLVCTMRQDYVNLCSDIPLLHARLEVSRYNLHRINQVGIARIVTEPLRLAGIESGVSQGLAKLVAKQVGERAGDLALVQMALTEAWNARSLYGDDLQTAYAQVGGVDGALAKAAEKIRGLWDEANRPRLDAIFVRLVKLGDTGGATRRVATRDEFDDESWTLVQFLAGEAGRRLVLIAGDERSPVAEIAHEALVNTWPHLQGNLHDHADYKRIFDQLIAKSKAWYLAAKMDQDERLAVGAELEGFLQLREAQPIWLSPREHTFVQVSAGARDLRKRRTRNSARALSISLALAVAASLGAGWFAFGSRTANQALNVALSQAEVAKQTAERNAGRVLSERGRQLIQDHEWDKAVVYMSEAQRLAPEDIEIKSLLPDLLRRLQVLRVQLGGYGQRLSGIDFSPNASHLVSWSNKGTKLWDVQSGALVASFSQVGTPSFSPTGESLVIACADGTALVWDLKSVSTRFNLSGHRGEVTIASFSPTGEWLLTASVDGTAKIWDLKNGNLLTTLTAHAHGVRAAVFDPSGELVLTYGGDHTAKLWRRATSALVAVLDGHWPSVEHAAFSPDGASILTVSSESIRVWDVESGKEIFSSPGRGASFSPDGMRLVIVGLGNDAQLWDVEMARSMGGERRAEAQRVLAEHTARILSASFSPDGQKIITSSSDQTANLWDGDTGKYQITLEGHSSIITSAVFDASGQKAITTSEDGRIKLWSAQTGRLLSTIVDREEEQPQAARWGAWAKVSSDGGTIASFRGNVIRLWEGRTTEFGLEVGKFNGIPRIPVFGRGSRLVAADAVRVELWDSAAGALVAKLPQSSVYDATFNNIGDRLLILGFSENVDEGRARLWDPKSGRQLAILEGDVGPVRATFSPDDALLATASSDNKVMLWDGRTGRLLASLAEHTDSVLNICFSADGRRVATASADHAVKIWDTKTYAVLARITGHTDAVRAVSFSANGQRVVTTSMDDTAVLWDSRTGARIALLGRGLRNSSFDASFNSTGERILTPFRYNSVVLSDGNGGHAIATLKGHTDRVVFAAFSSNGSRVVTASADKTAKIWDTADGKLLATLEGHADALRGAWFSEDGQRLVTVSDDSTAKIWTTQSARLLGTMEGHRGPVRSAAFSPDGTRIVTLGLDDSTIRLWDVALETRSSDEISRLVAEQAAWRLEGGTLFPNLRNAEVPHSRATTSPNPPAQPQP